MNILVTGGKGQLASCIMEVSIIFNHKITYVSHSEFDITNLENIKEYLNNHDVDAIINCAAYTDVDKAENDYDNAYKVNAEGPRNLFTECAKRNIRLIHISTDFVAPEGISEPFSGEIIDANKIPNAYGKTKYYGENFIRTIGFAREYKNYTIIRTSWLYSEYGKNFVKTIFSNIMMGKKMDIVDDQIGTPTYAITLAIFILQTIEYEDMPNLLCFSNTGVASWFDFAHSIGELCNVPFSIEPCSHKKFKREAKRQSYSVMDKRKTEEFLEKHSLGKIPYWRNSLEVCVSHLLDMYNEKGEE